MSFVMLEVEPPLHFAMNTTGDSHYIELLTESSSIIQLELAQFIKPNSKICSHYQN